MEQILEAAKKVASAASDEPGDGFLMVWGNPTLPDFPGEVFGCFSDKWDQEHVAISIAAVIREAATTLKRSPADLAKLVASKV